MYFLNKINKKRTNKNFKLYLSSEYIEIVPEQYINYCYLK